MLAQAVEHSEGHLAHVQAACTRCTERHSEVRAGLTQAEAELQKTSKLLGAADSVQGAIGAKARQAAAAAHARAGEMVDRATENVVEAARAVEEQNKAGSLTLTL